MATVQLSIDIGATPDALPRIAIVEGTATWDIRESGPEGRYAVRISGSGVVPFKVLWTEDSVEQKREYVVNFVPSIILSTLEDSIAEVLEKVLPLGTAAVIFSPSQTNPDGGLIDGPLVIDDDYLVANGRRFSLIVTALTAPVSAELVFKKNDDNRIVLSATDGAIVALGSNRYTVTFEMNAAASNGKEAGAYAASLLLTDANNHKYTPAHNLLGNQATIQFIKRY